MIISDETSSLWLQQKHFMKRTFSPKMFDVAQGFLVKICNFWVVKIDLVIQVTVVVYFQG